MELLDTTLREGEQTPGVSFSVEDKVKMARLLDRFGIDIIETGHPVVSEDVKDACRKIAQLDLSAATLCHARAAKEDIQLAAEVGAEWVGIFLGTSDLSLEHKFNLEQEGALRLIRESVEYAKNLRLKVRFTPEDATRTEWEFLNQVLVQAEESGADRVSLADTVGTAQPHQIKDLVSKAVNSVTIPVHIHCHDDYGMAVANSLAGYESGAHLIDVTINGLGERTGITPLAPLVAALTQLHDVDKDWKLEFLPQLSSTVERLSGNLQSPRAPITGDYAFSHKAGLHTRAVLENPQTYEAIPPDIVNKSRQIVIDKYAGKAAVANRLEQMGLEPDDRQLSEIVDRVKETAMNGKQQFHDTDMLEIADEVLNFDVTSRSPADMEALISLTLYSTSYSTRATRKVVSKEEVDQVYEITGGQDIVVHVTSGSVPELNDLIEDLRNMEEVKETETSLILKDYQTTSGNAQRLASG